MEVRELGCCGCREQAQRDIEDRPPETKMHGTILEALDLLQQSTQHPPRTDWYYTASRHALASRRYITAAACMT